MVKLTDLKGDQGAREEGRWVNWIHGTRLRIASVDNPKYRQHRERLLRPYRSRLNSMTGDEISKITLPAVTRHLLLDWEGFDGEDGKALKYTPELGLTMLADPDWNHLLDFVFQAAGDEAAFLKAGIEDVAGN